MLHTFNPSCHSSEVPTFDSFMGSSMRMEWHGSKDTNQQMVWYVMCTWCTFGMHFFISPFSNGDWFDRNHSLWVDAHEVIWSSYFLNSGTYLNAHPTRAVRFIVRCGRLRTAFKHWGMCKMSYVYFCRCFIFDYLRVWTFSRIWSAHIKIKKHLSYDLTFITFAV